MAEHLDYLIKATNSLLGAENELNQRRYDNSVNRAYYAGFQAAVAALIAADVAVNTEGGKIISHRTVHRQFAELLIQRRKIYPSHLRNSLQDLLRERIVADYHSTSVSSTKAERAVRQSQSLVNEVEGRLQITPGS